ncbi:NHL repeat-containing protein [Tanacetum coccineum]
MKVEDVGQGSGKKPAKITIKFKAKGNFQIASEGLKHRVFEISLADPQNDEDHSYRKIHLKAEDVQGKNVLTNFWAPQPVDNDFSDFLPWLRHKFRTEIIAHLSIRKSSYSRSLFDCKTIKTGDCMLKVPLSVQLTQDILPPKVSSLLGKDVISVTEALSLILKATSCVIITRTLYNRGALVYQVALSTLSFILVMYRVTVISMKFENQTIVSDQSLYANSFFLCVTVDNIHKRLLAVVVQHSDPSNCGLAAYDLQAPHDRIFLTTLFDAKSSTFAAGANDVAVILLGRQLPSGGMEHGIAQSQLNQGSQLNRINQMYSDANSTLFNAAQDTPNNQMMSNMSAMMPSQPLVPRMQLVGFRCGKTSGIATPRAVVRAGDKTSGDARSWYMISEDAKSWVCFDKGSGTSKKTGKAKISKKRKVIGSPFIEKNLKVNEMLYRKLAEQKEKRKAEEVIKAVEDEQKRKADEEAVAKAKAEEEATISKAAKEKAKAAEEKSKKKTTKTRIKEAKGVKVTKISETEGRRLAKLEATKKATKEEARKQAHEQAKKKEDKKAAQAKDEKQKSIKKAYNEEIAKETDDVDDVFKNIQTMPFLNTSTRSKTRQANKEDMESNEKDEGSNNENEVLSVAKGKKRETMKKKTKDSNPKEKKLRNNASEDEDDT